LETPIAKPVVHKKKKFWYLQYAASLLLLFAKPSGTKAQVKPPVTVTPPQPIRMGTVAYVPPVEKPSFLIKGTVVDEAGEPIVSASVTIKGYSHGVATDKEGHYQLRVKQKDIIMFSAIGYESQQIVANEKDLSITTVLKTSQRMLEGQIVVVGGLSWNNDDAIDYDVPRHRALLQVKDKTNNGPLPNASLTIVENNRGKQNQVQTNREGAYLMRRVKANETYTVIVTAKGYQTKSLLVNGSDLKSGNNPKTILLEKEPVVQILEEVVVNCVIPPDNNNDQPSANIYMTSGLVSGPMIWKEIPKEPTQKLQPKAQEIPTDVGYSLQGKVGGIVVQSVSPKRKTSFFKKIFSKPGASSNTPAPISIYPNPAKINSPIVIAFETVPKGSYRLQLINAIGSLVQQQQITVPAEGFHFQWALSSQIAAGHYIINVMDAKGKIIHNGKMMVL
jgi:CarboxypepD_reg-like domain/Carboxypeptidase regulatory-like domain